MNTTTNTAINSGNNTELNINNYTHYRIADKWYGMLPVTNIVTIVNNEGFPGYCPAKIGEWLGRDVNRFYEDTSPITDGSYLLIKSVLVHVFVRIAQVFADVIAGGVFLILGVTMALFSPCDYDSCRSFTMGIAGVGVGLYTLTVALAIDSGLAVTSPFEGIYEAIKVFFSFSDRQPSDNG